MLILASCVSKKKIVYFQDLHNTELSRKVNPVLKYKNGDLIIINVSAKDLDAVKSFNLPIVSYNAVTNSVSGEPKQQSYLIDYKGFIDFPVLGKIKLAGLSRREAIELISNELKPYVKEPSVNIQITNFRINVLGDVKSPGAFLIQNERATVLDAIALAGDTNISGDRLIEVKREENGRIITGFLDLTSNNIFSSKFYFLQQNDNIYVRPNNAKIQSASYNQNTGLFISIASVLITLISILTR